MQQRGAERVFGDGAQGDFLAVPDERDGVAAAPPDVGGREAVRPGGHGGSRIAAGGEDQQIADGRLEAPQRTGRIQRQRRLGPSHRVDEQVDRAERAAEEQPRLAGAHLGEAAPLRRPSAARATPPRDPPPRARRTAAARGSRSMPRARDAGDVARQPALGGAGRGGRTFAGDGGDVRRDRGIEGARGLVERRLQRLRIERRRVPGGGGEGGRGRRVAAQRGDAGKPAQGVGHVVGGGQSLPENQRVSLSLAAALSRAAAGRPLVVRPAIRGAERAAASARGRPCLRRRLTRGAGPRGGVRTRAGSGAG